jgi:hypothetical protein
MNGPSALQLALDLHRMPSFARAARWTTFPPNLLLLIRIVSGSQEAMGEAIAITGERPERIHAAAAFFLQQALLGVEGDHYRTLGVPRDASRALINEHARNLTKWLHPDRDAASWDSALAARVLHAWSELKDPARRAEYDRSLGRMSSRQRRGSGRATGIGRSGLSPAARRQTLSLRNSSWRRWFSVRRMIFAVVVVVVVGSGLVAISLPLMLWSN